MIDLQTDFALFDHVQPITLERAGSHTREAVDLALCRAVFELETAPSAGAARQADARWLLAAQQVTAPPAPGDVIESATGERWTVLQVDRCTLDTRYRCLARRLSLAEDLCDLLVLQRAQWTTDASGAAVAHWDAVEPPLAGRIQLLTAEVQQEHAAQQLKVSHRIYLTTLPELNVGDRFLHGDAIYCWQGFEQPASTAAWPVVLVERVS